MTPADTCKTCDGVGKILNKNKAAVSLIPFVITCHVCEGTGWDPEAMKKELEAKSDAIENVKL